MDILGEKILLDIIDKGGEGGRVMNFFRERVPQNWTIYLDHFASIIETNEIYSSSMAVMIYK